jgi:ferredoxin
MAQSALAVIEREAQAHMRGSCAARSVGWSQMHGRIDEAGQQMKLDIDPTKCRGAGLCQAAFPEAIDLEDWGFPRMSDSRGGTFGVVPVAGSQQAPARRVRPWLSGYDGNLGSAAAKTILMARCSAFMGTCRNG